MTHHRMIVHQEDIVEKEVEISNNTFIRSDIPLPSTPLSNFSFHRMTMDYQTHLIIAGAVIIAIIVMAITVRFIMTRSSKDSQVNVINYNTANSGYDNAIMIDQPDPVPSPPVQAKLSTDDFDHIDVEKILKKEVHLRNGWERMAVTRYSQRQNKEH